MNVVLLFCNALLALAGTNPRPYPPADSYLKTTSFLDHESYIQELDDHQWYLDNIPFIDVPEKSLQDVYYYRTSVNKRHLRWTHEGHGWISTEFIQPVAWASKFQTIPDSAAHQVLELRWLRDQNYAKDIIQEYTRGGVEKLSGITYTNYMQTATLEHAQATGDVSFLVSQLEGMIASYNLWNVTIDATTGLYHRNPLLDAQEYSLPGYLVGGPGGGPMQEWNDFGLDAAEGGGNDYDLIWLGPETYRPDFNAYMVSGARAISVVAAMAGNSSLAKTWETYADDLYSRMEKLIYSDELNFWIDVVQGTNLRCEGRELIGYYPYRFGVGTNATQVEGLAAATNNEHFLTEFGPTTLEQTNPYYTALKNTTYCCQWQGQSWPFSTCVFLDVLAMIARDNLSDVITPELFYDQLMVYTRTNYKDGVPFTAESHYPTIDEWSGDTTNHSENYFHSTYMDNIFTNLFGIVPSFGDRLVLQPLVPSNWSYFVVENLPYHGTLLTMVWDKDGTHYSSTGGPDHSAGFSIYSNGTMFHHQPTLSAVNITLPFNTTEAAAQLAAQPEYQNILANPNTPWGLPSVTADWCLNVNGDRCPYPAFKMNDGLLWYDTVPDNRWTNNQSEFPYSTISITLPRAREMHSISLAIFVDVDRGGVVDCPQGIKVVDGNGDTVAMKNPWNDCVPNALNTLPFAPPTPNASDNTTTPSDNTSVTTDFLQVIISDKLRYTTAISEIQIWVPPSPGPRYEAEDGVIGTFIGYFEGRATGLNGTIVDGGVSLGQGGWVELADVRRPAIGDSAYSSGGLTSMTLIGGGTGTVEVQMNWLTNHTVMFSGDANKTIEVDMLQGGNVVTIFQTSGAPFIDAFVLS